MSEQVNPELTQQEADAMAAAVMEFWKSGGTLALVKGISAEECEAMYIYGHSLYAQGKYKDAFKIFALLVTYNHMDSRYQFALATTMQMTGLYKEALQQYIIVTVMRLDDPVPIFHSAECFLALGQLEEARESLELVTGSLCKPGEHDALKARAEALLRAIEVKSK